MGARGNSRFQIEIFNQDEGAIYINRLVYVAYDHDVEHVKHVSGRLSAGDRGTEVEVPLTLSDSEFQEIGFRLIEEGVAKRDSWLLARFQAVWGSKFPNTLKRQGCCDRQSVGLQNIRVGVLQHNHPEPRCKDALIALL